MDRTILHRIAPPLAFAFALCILVVCCYDSGFTGLPPTEKRYVAAKAGIANLLRNDKKNMQREPWEKLATEFRDIYNADPAWPNRPAALFRAAEAFEQLATRSCARSDARQAINCYETVALRHASSRLADDALFRAARMRAAWLRDEKGALTLLERIKKQYPNGDMLGEAEALEKAIKAASRGRAAPEALAAITRPTSQLADEQAETASAKKSAAAFAGDLPLRYRAAKSRMTALGKDKIKSCWRQPWEELREEFLKIHKAGKHRLAVNALFQAAACQQSLAACSRLSADSRKAEEMYINVSRQYPAHALADDALFNAALIRWDRKKGGSEANDLLEKIVRDYPRGDMAPQARRMLARMAPGQKAPAKKTAVAEKTPEKPELQVLSWDSHGKNSVEISLELSAPSKYTLRKIDAARGRPPRLVLDLENAAVVSDVRKGVTVNGSLLQAVRVRDIKNGGASLQFDFRDVRLFEARNEDDPCRIVLAVAAGNARLPGNTTTVAAKGKKNVIAAKAPPTARATQVSNMASQLGLTVHRVFIDAGHGGKDPGTSHNKITERDITLDIGLALGRLLQANGLEVIYSRTRDRAIALSERTRLANVAKADLFVSVHVNAHDNAAVSGFETYFLDLASNPQAARVAMIENAASDKRLGDMQNMLAEVMLNARADASKRLASDIQRLSMFRLKKRQYSVRDNGVKSAPFHVLLGAQMPAVLVEVGYCSNTAEARNLATAKYRNAIAEGVAEGILAYRNRLLNNRTAENALTGRRADAM